MLGKWNPKTSFMDFWNKPNVVINVTNSANDINLTSFTIADIPAGATIIRVIGMFKYSKRVELSGSENETNVEQFISIDSSASRLSLVNMITIPDNSFNTAGDAVEGGDVLMGNIDVKAEVIGNGNYYPQWELSDVTVNGLSFYDVQVGVRVYFR